MYMELMSPMCIEYDASIFGDVRQSTRQVYTSPPGGREEAYLGAEAFSE